ncbi:MAG: 2-C-methyl-D-erythritol 2,4-cyclodiphosphate synthase [Bacteroidetes bacterium]|nr:2-C-methyl-D-erythritol 2,4-cyclodiphosphate synthase [Bacteroidota bacterium]
MSFRIGYGFDVHQLKEGADFWLGGIKIEHTKGAVGHSDADVLIHTICDAVLGAANLRDIGFHFPDTSSEYKGIDSKILLGDVMKIVRESGFEIGNIDSTICLQTPKINPHIPAMQKALAACMGIAKDQLSIKATTTEKLGFVGLEKGVSAHAVALLLKS